jgi:molybdopterin converting factor subunit 1
MITARLFARLREQAGTNCEQLELAGGTVAEVYDLLRSQHPNLEPDRTLIRVARNEEFARWEDRVADGDEVAFIPPVSGGTEAARRIELTGPNELEASLRA